MAGRKNSGRRKAKVGDANPKTATRKVTIVVDEGETKYAATNGDVQPVVKAALADLVPPLSAGAQTFVDWSKGNPYIKPQEKPDDTETKLLSALMAEARIFQKKMNLEARKCNKQRHCLRPNWWDTHTDEDPAPKYVRTDPSEWVFTPEMLDQPSSMVETSQKTLVEDDCALLRKAVLEAFVPTGLGFKPVNTNVIKTSTSPNASTLERKRKRANTLESAPTPLQDLKIPVAKRQKVSPSAANEVEKTGAPNNAIPEKGLSPQKRKVCFEDDFSGSKGDESPLKRRKLAVGGADGSLQKDQVKPPRQAFPALKRKYADGSSTAESLGDKSSGKEGPSPKRPKLDAK